MSKVSTGRVLIGGAAVVAASLLVYACAGGSGGASVAAGDAAARVYVAPGSYDEFYAFMSGGFNGQIGVYGLPSGRRLKTIPVFSQYPENGYGYTEETKPLLNTSFGMIPWDDTHHPALSQTNGEDDGRWLFINGNNTPRVARIELTRMETEEIIEIPNAAGNHGSPFVTENTEYLVASTRFSVPVPNRDVPIGDFKKAFKGQISFVVANEPGKMRIAFQLVVPGFSYDLARSGKGPSHGWMFLSTYNTEQANSLLEVNASQNDKDYVAAVNWKAIESCAKAGKARPAAAEYMHNYMDEKSRVAKSERMTSVPQLTPADCPGSIYFMPTPKSPHGADVDPTGEYITAGGKLASVIPVHSFSKMTKAIEGKEFAGEIDGIPVLKYESTIAGEVTNPGLGPLHTQFDDKGFAYTSFFLSSEIVKWNVETREVVDRVPTYYSIGHLLVPGGGTSKPTGKYVVAMNKITKDRYLPTGPELTQSAQLYDITGDKMKLLLDFPTEGEPHYAQAILASKIKDRQVKFFTLAENTHPQVAKTEAAAGISRQGRAVHVKMTSIRSHFAPDNIEGVRLGDTVYFHVTNLEQDWDIPHGFAVMGNAQAAELLIMPGETRTLKWVPTKVGVHPFYCTDFCSALHQEMQGYIRVSAPGSAVALTATLSKPTTAPAPAGNK
ncbi:MAG: Sec-dependent nitrous-oxide reductase [Gemmatimonadetes bacterium]|nr:Sec-dependent nitrous-oxide reductase [Gemmatimonadota bacterium]